LIVAWRIAKARHANTAFDGEGARREGGRWNPRGVPVVYAAESLSLAALEQFVHIPKAAAGISFISFKVEIPPEVKVAELGIASLPPNWRAEPVPDETMAIGEAWFKGRTSSVLKVPSVIIPEEFDYVLNPVHPEFRKIRIKTPKSFSFDPRMWK
jgi:RES domain-containing protein